MCDVCVCVSESGLFCKYQVMRSIWVILVVLGVATMRGAECRKARRLEETLEYYAISCRAHSASITDFGGVGDGKTLNTKAFREAISQLSQYESDGGSQLFVPPGQWLTGSFNLTSHFTLYLHKDAVLLASQVLFLFQFQYCSLFLAYL